MAVTTRARGSARRRPSSHHGVLPVYSGPFKAEQAERLLWRAGFGPRPGQAEQWLGHEATPIVPGASGFTRMQVVQ
jgi:hypothetical protein